MIYICPKHGFDVELNVGDAGKRICPKCQAIFLTSKNVVCFEDKSDSFYEGTYQNQVKFIPTSEKWHAVWPFWMINSGYMWTIRKYVKEKSTILDLGCAGGIAYFGKRYNMIGADLSLESLSKAREYYQNCFMADVTQSMPLASKSVDAIISSFFWEHLDSNQKEQLLAECERILRPGGKIIFLFDIETQNPLISIAKKMDYSLYDKEFLAQDRHIGYESIKTNLEYFLKKFRLLELKGLEKTPFQSPSVYCKLRHWKGGFVVLGILNRLLNIRILFYAYTFFIRVIDETLGRCLPSNWSRIAKCVCIKEKLPKSYLKHA
jgi:SAM-dependent methyltransferase